MRLPIAESMESRIFTRTSAYFNKGGLAVKYLRERERERESSKNIVTAKCFGHFNISVFLRRDSAIQASLMALAAPSVLLSLNKVYMSLSVLHNCYLICFGV